MNMIKNYLPTALRPNRWEGFSNLPSESRDDPRSIIGPEDFASTVISIISIIVLFLVIIYADSDDRYPFLKHAQFIWPALFALLLGPMKMQAYHQRRSQRGVNIVRICQCFFIWGNGFMLAMYLLSAFT